MVHDAEAGDQPELSEDHARVAHEAQEAHRDRLAWRAEQLRVWDVLQLAVPWVLLTISTAAYFAWALPAAADPFWPDGAVVLGLVTISVFWILLGHTLPLRRRALRPMVAGVFLAGLLLLCAALMSYSETFLVFTVTGFFHAYLLRPWPVGMIGVFATSVVLNGSAMHVWTDPSSAVLAEFVLIVTVQTAAISVGILLTARNEPVERRREELVDRLEQALRENAGLYAQLVAQAREAGVQDERQRLAGEIHDTLAQSLAGIITQLQAAERPGQMPDDRDAHVARAVQLAREALTEARRSVRALAPQELGHAHLPDALRALTERWAENHGIDARTSVNGPAEPLNPAIEVALFRVAQESLTNVAKHADATRVGVTLSYSGAEVMLDVRDDGCGFAEPAGGGFGITSIRQRIRGVGGHVDVQSSPGAGTSISARVPAIYGGGMKAASEADG
ncbi:sensor histidine kinase [Cellulosimicrobium funkei]|nr:sensor histidine kinase [Cellulosimicrobium funkei]